MREILFRGKRMDNGEWVEGWYQPETTIKYWDGRQETIGVTISYKVEDGFLEDTLVDPSTIGQYTGLTDKNGERIFEGDIVAFEDAVADFEGYHDDVFVNHGAVSIFPYGGVSFSNRQTVEMDDLYDTDDSIDAEVIGNIHDNPELLEGGEG